MVIIEHKLPLIMQISDRIIVMDEGSEIAEGRPEDVVRDARVIEGEGVNVDGTADLEVY